MHVTVFGATGKIGQLVVGQLDDLTYLQAAPAISN